METKGVFVLAFVVEVVVGYNPFMHKTQPQKLIFLFFVAFLVGSTPNFNLHLKYKHTLKLISPMLISLNFKSNTL
jgi:hypothetical protein